MRPLPSDTPLKCVPAGYCPAGQPQWHVLEKGDARGKHLYFADRLIGQGGELRTLLFVHGNPECSYIFSEVIRILLALDLPQTRIVTFDHIGFGLSSQATGPVSPTNHVDNLCQLLAYLGLSRVTMVVHDWGGPIGLGAMLEQPERLRQLVVLNSGIFPLSRQFNYRNYPLPCLSWVRMSSLVPNRHWGCFAASAIACRAGSPGRLFLRLLGYPARNRERLAGDNPYVAQFASPSNVASSKHLARLAGHWCEPCEEGSPALNALYRRLQHEVRKRWGASGSGMEARLLCGEWDPLGGRENARLWLHALPQMEHHMTFFPGCGHFVTETHAPDVARAIYALLTLPDVSG